MNIIIKKILQITPKLINKLPEEHITEEALNFVIEHGYQVDENTPVSFLKYEKVASLFLEKYRDEITSYQRILTFQELNNLLKHQKLHKLLISDKFINPSNYFDPDRSILIEMLKNNIDELNIEKCQKLIKNNKKLLYEYLKHHINDYKSFIDVIPNYEIIYQIIKENPTNFSVKNINIELFGIWFNHDHSIILNSELPDEVLEHQSFYSYIMKSGYTKEDFITSSLINRHSIAIYFLKKDFSIIEHISIIEKRSIEDIINIFLSDIRTNAKYIDKISTLINSDDIEEPTKIRIMETILNENVLIPSSNWSFITYKVTNDYTNSLHDTKKRLEVLKVALQTQDNLIEPTAIKK